MNIVFMIKSETSSKPSINTITVFFSEFYFQEEVKDFFNESEKKIVSWDSSHVFIRIFFQNFKLNLFIWSIIKG